MIDDLMLVLGRERDAAHVLEARLRALELVHAAGEQRFLAMAVDEVESASERLAAIELTRALTLAAVGAPDDVVASDLAAGLDRDVAHRFTVRIEELRAVVERVEVLRGRLRHVVVTARDEGRQRLLVAGVA